MAGVAVTEFNASQNPLGQQGAVYLARLLNVKRIPTQFLHSIFLDSCHITDAGGAVLVRCMCDCACATLFTIVVYACACHQQSVVLWLALYTQRWFARARALKAWWSLQMRSLQANGTLRTLVARQNKMSNATATSLGSMLLQNTALVTLSLAWNAIGPTGGAAISQGLGYNNSLRVCCFVKSRLRLRDLAVLI